MQNIDFLPTAYRERNALRDARAWWGIVVLVFGTVILATASVQFTWRRSVERDLEAIQTEYMAASQRDMELARLQKQIQAASEAAGLYTYLQHPWPRSQILATIAGPIPESIQLHEIHLGEEAITVAEADAPASSRRRTSSKDKDAPKLPPAQQDLAALRKECDARRTVVSLSGVAEDVQQLHAYVAELGKAPIVAHAQLRSLEAVSSGDSPDSALSNGESSPLRGTRFSVHLAIKPGYGQPGGPEPKSAPKPGSTAQNAVRSPLAGGPR